MLIIHRYKPDVKLRFVTEELGFESDEEAARFICDNGGEDFLKTRNEEVMLDTGVRSGGLFESARIEAFKKVDIKGQI
jgi:SAC3 family protein LENG8/THP3